MTAYSRPIPRRRAQLRTPDAEHLPHAALGVSPELRSKIEIHHVSDFEQRLIRDWIGPNAQSQQLDIEGAVASCMLPVISDFIKAADFTLHGRIGENQKPPSYKTIETAGTSVEIPADVRFFLEAKTGNERVVLQTEDFNDGDHRLTLHANVPHEWMQRLKEFAFTNNPLRGRAFDLKGCMLEIEGISPSDLVLTEKQASAIQRHIIGFATRFRELESRGARLSRGILLEGTPGCGKSLLLKTLPEQLPDFSVCLVTPEQLRSRNALDILNRLIELTAPCAVLLEEIDLFATDRGMGGGADMAELMQMMDGLRHISGVQWIATTNRPEVIERALSDRPGRFDRRIEFGPLDLETRGRLVDQLVKPQTISRDGREFMIHETEGWTGAQIGELCETMRLLVDQDAFDSSHVELALEDCGFHGQGGFGFRRG